MHRLLALLPAQRDQRIIAARLERHVLTKGAALREVEAILCAVSYQASE